MRIPERESPSRKTQYALHLTLLNDRKTDYLTEIPLDHPF